MTHCSGIKSALDKRENERRTKTNNSVAVFTTVFISRGNSRSLIHLIVAIELLAFAEEKNGEMGGQGGTK